MSAPPHLVGMGMRRRVEMTRENGKVLDRADESGCEYLVLQPTGEQDWWVRAFANRMGLPL